jgi:hypothetical protein
MSGDDAAGAALGAPRDVRWFSQSTWHVGKEV